MSTHTVYYRNSFTNYNNRCRLWADQSEQYAYRIHDRDPAYLDMHIYKDGLYDSAQGYRSAGGIYYHLKKKRLSGPMLLSYLILRPITIFRRVHGLYKKLYFLVHRFFYRRIHKKISMAKYYSRVREFITRHSRHRHKPWERRELIGKGKYNKAIRLKKVTPLVLRLTLLFQFKYSFESKLYRNRIGYSRRGPYMRKYRYSSTSRARGKVKYFFRMLNRLLQKEVHESIRFFYQLPEGILSYRKIFSFHEYCLFLLKHYPPRRLSVQQKYILPTNKINAFAKGVLEHDAEYEKNIRASNVARGIRSTLIIRKGRIWRRRDKRKFRRNFPRLLGNLIMTQVGRKPWKWTYGYAQKRKHREYKQAKRHRPQKAPVHIENKMHGQLMIFESLASRICEMNQEKLFRFFTRVVKKENVVKLGVLFIAIFRRLDMYLRRYFPRATLQRVREIIKNGAIQVNGTTVRDMDFVVDLCDVVSMNLRNTSPQYFFANNFITMFYVVFTMGKNRLRRYMKSRLYIILHRELRRVRTKYLTTFRYRKVWATALQRLVGPNAAYRRRRKLKLHFSDLPEMYIDNSVYTPNFSSNIHTDKVEQFAYMRYTYLRRIRKIDGLRDVIQYKKFFDFVDSMSYVVRCARLFNKHVELYANPVSMHETRTLTRLLRIGYGTIWAKIQNIAARVDEVQLWGFLSHHHTYSYWERFMDNFYDALRTLLPRRLFEAITYSTHFIIIRHDVDIVKEVRAHNEIFDIPKTSDTYQAPYVFNRTVQDKNVVRRTMAHSPFTTSRRIRYGNSIDNYQTYI